MTEIKLTTSKRTNTDTVPLEITDEKTITCESCFHKLVHIIKLGITTENTLTVLQVQCPFCQDITFKHNIFGKFFMAAEGDLVIADAPAELKDNIKYILIKVEKS
jgi:hypothetical protein